MAAIAVRPVPAGPHSDEVIPPHLWPMAHSIAAEVAANYRSTVAEQSEPAELAYRQAAKQIEEMTQGGAGQGIAAAHLRLGIDHGNLGELRNTLANALARAAEAVRELRPCITVQLPPWGTGTPRQWNRLNRSSQASLAAQFQMHRHHPCRFLRRPPTLVQVRLNGGAKSWGVRTVMSRVVTSNQAPLQFNDALRKHVVKAMAPAPIRIE